MMDEEIEIFGKMAVALNILEGTQEFAALSLRFGPIWFMPERKRKHATRSWGSMGASPS